MSTESLIVWKILNLDIAITDVVSTLREPSLLDCYPNLIEDAPNSSVAVMGSNYVIPLNNMSVQI